MNIIMTILAIFILVIVILQILNVALSQKVINILYGLFILIVILGNNRQRYTYLHKPKIKILKEENYRFKNSSQIAKYLTFLGRKREASKPFPTKLKNALQACYCFRFNYCHSVHPVTRTCFVKILIHLIHQQVNGKSKWHIVNDYHLWPSNYTTPQPKSLDSLITKWIKNH